MPLTERAQSIRRLEEVNEKYLAKLEEWGVFLKPTLYDEFERCHMGADEELKRLNSDSQQKEDRALNAQCFWRSCSQACQKVRDRIKSLAVLPGM